MEIVMHDVHIRDFADFSLDTYTGVPFTEPGELLKNYK